MLSYPSDVTDLEWQILEPLIPKAKKGGRHRTTNMRGVINGIFYVLKSGCQWSMLPHDLPPKGTVYEYFKTWREDGTFEKMHRKLRRITRVINHHPPDERTGSMDSQTMKTTEEALVTGYDGGKKLKGRKRHLLVDSLGLIIEVLIHAANIQDRDGGKYLIAKAKTNGSTVKKVRVDGAYRGPLIEFVAKVYQIMLEVVKKPKGVKGFAVIPKRWVVERTFGWLVKQRRLAKDFERLNETVRSLIFLAMSRLMVRRIALEYA